MAIYTADNEEPKCERCDHINSPEKYCIKHCGPENAWNGYRRSIREGEDKS